MIGCFGKKLFQITLNQVRTFQKLDYSETLSTESIESTKGKPATYIKGRELMKASLSIMLNVGFGVDPLQEVEDWRGILAEETPQKLIIGGKSLIENKFLLMGVEVTDCAFDTKGKMLACAVTLSLQEFVKPGQKKETGAASGKSAAPAINYSVQDHYKVATTSPESKADKKARIMHERMTIAP